MVSRSPRLAAGVAALAVLPALAYAVLRPDYAGYLSALSLVLIALALYIAFSPADTEGAGEPS